jgi:hypothetical protein
MLTSAPKCCGKGCCAQLAGPVVEQVVQQPVINWLVLEPDHDPAASLLSSLRIKVAVLCVQECRFIKAAGPNRVLLLYLLLGGQLINRSGP